MAPVVAPGRSSEALASSQDQDDPLIEAYSTSASTSAIGAGSYGLVVLRRRRSDNECHALKFVDAMLNPKWMREYTLLRDLCHPNVVRVVDVFRPVLPLRPQGVIVFVPADMDLAAFLERRSDRVSVEAAQTIIKQACSGLAYVHGQHIIHRDIKPRNILVTFSGLRNLQVSIADFGLARLLPADARVPCSDAGPGPLVEMSRRVVTAYYRAPELVFADRTKKVTPYNTQVDVWSLGCVMYALLEGRPLTTNETIEGWIETVSRVIGVCPMGLPWSQEATVRTELCALHQVGLPRAPEGGEMCSLKALRWDPQERSTCRALLADAWLSGAAAADAATATGSRQPETLDSSQGQNIVTAQCGKRQTRDTLDMSTIQRLPTPPEDMPVLNIGTVQMCPRSGQGDDEGAMVQTPAACDTSSCPRVPPAPANLKRRCPKAMSLPRRRTIARTTEAIAAL